MYHFIQLSTMQRPEGARKYVPTVRATICELYSIGWGYKRIRKKHSHISLSTIRYANK